MTLRCLLICILGSAIAGCASTGFLMAQPEVVLFGSLFPPKAPTEQVEVFHSQKPDRPYHEIARISVRDTDDNWSMQQILIKARQLGADAVVMIGRTGSYGVGVPVGNTAVVASSSEYGLAAVAIRFKGNAVPAEPPTEPRQSTIDIPVRISSDLVASSALASRYLGILQRAPKGTPWEDAARFAVQQRWDQVVTSVGAPQFDHIVSFGLRGFALFAKQDFLGSAEALERSFNADPSNALTAYFLGWAHEFRGEPRMANNAWRAAAYLDPTLAEVYIALADSYLRLGQTALAVQSLCSGLAALPNSPDISKRLAAANGQC